MNIDFHNPVYVGDTLTYTGKLAKVRKSIKQIYIDVEITRVNSAMENIEPPGKYEGGGGGKKMPHSERSN
jgi:acyl dehydratase